MTSLRAGAALLLMDWLLAVVVVVMEESLTSCYSCSPLLIIMIDGTAVSLPFVAYSC